MTKKPVLPGVWWVEIPEVDLRILCGSPMDCVKHLMQQGHIRPVEKDGIPYETGPNAILVSDLTIQGGRFWNLAEFPVLHMLYRQGMVLPNHPGNTGARPLLVGMKERVESVLDYIYRGNYGLASREEMRQFGVPEADLEDLWKLKIRFAGGGIKSPQELIDTVYVHQDPREILPGVRIERLETNVYCIRYGNESTTVDMNFSPGTPWKASYTLPQVRPLDGAFTVIHTGEGNGWDPDRPCMGSIVTHHGQTYLVDAGGGCTKHWKPWGWIFLRLMVFL